MNPWYQLALVRAAILISIFLSGCVTAQERCEEYYDVDTKPFNACVQRIYAQQAHAMQNANAVYQMFETPAPRVSHTTCDRDSYELTCTTVSP